MINWGKNMLVMKMSKKMNGPKNRLHFSSVYMEI